VGIYIYICVYIHLYIDSAPAGIPRAARLGLHSPPCRAAQRAAPGPTPAPASMTPRKRPRTCPPGRPGRRQESGRQKEDTMTTTTTTTTSTTTTTTTTTCTTRVSPLRQHPHNLGARVNLGSVLGHVLLGGLKGGKDRVVSPHIYIYIHTHICIYISGQPGVPAPSSTTPRVNPSRNRVVRKRTLLLLLLPLLLLPPPLLLLLLLLGLTLCTSIHEASEASSDMSSWKAWKQAGIGSSKRGHY